MNINVKDVQRYGIRIRETNIDDVTTQFIYQYKGYHLLITMHKGEVISCYRILSSDHQFSRYDIEKYIDELQAIRNAFSDIRDINEPNMLEWYDKQIEYFKRKLGEL